VALAEAVMTFFVFGAKARREKRVMLESHLDVEIVVTQMKMTIPIMMILPGGRALVVLVRGQTILNAQLYHALGLMMVFVTSNAVSQMK